MKPSQCEACRAVGPTVMCNLCPTGPRRSVQPPATPQEPDLREDIERHNAEIQRLGNAVRDGSATPEMAYAWLTHPYVCTSDMVKAAARIMASAPPAVWQDKTADELRRIAAHIRTPGHVWAEDAIDEIARLLENRARQLSPLPSPPTPGGK